MSLREVQDQITKKYSFTVHYSMISWYTNKGLLNALPKKMGPIGTLSKSTYKFLCNALSSFIPINQMNTCAADNTQFKLIATLVKMLSNSSTEVDKLLRRLLRDTAINTMSGDKLNSSEDRRIWWTTFQNLDLWFDSWESFLGDFGFTHYDANDELVFKDGAKSLTWARLVSHLMGAMVIEDDARWCHTTTSISCSLEKQHPRHCSWQRW